MPNRPYVSALLVAALSALSLTACGGGEDAVDVRPDEAEGEVRQLAEYETTRVFRHIGFLETVGGHAVPGTNEAVILTQFGLAYIAELREGAPGPRVFLDLRGRAAPDPDYEEGMLGITFAPDYETSGEFYVNYTADDPRRNVISRFTAHDGIPDVESERIIMEIEQPSKIHNGGALAFGPDGYLYIAVGDGGHDAGEAQNTDSVLGSILRIDVSQDPYAIPPDNPFANGGGAPEIYAWGLRNPWRITFDPETGVLWAGDVGQADFEEVNVIERGGNYGWRIMEGPECYRGRDPEDCDPEGLLPPRAWYGRENGCAIIGGYVYRGSRLPELYGHYIYADHCHGYTWALDVARDDSEPIQIAYARVQVTTILRAQDGELYLVSLRDGIHGLNMVEPTPEPAVTPAAP